MRATDKSGESGVTEVDQDIRDGIFSRSVYFVHDRATCDEAGRSLLTYTCEYHRGYEDGIDAACQHVEGMLVEQARRAQRADG